MRRSLLCLLFALMYSVHANSESTVVVKVQGKSPFELKNMKTIIASGPNNECSPKMNSYFAKKIADIVGVPKIVPLEEATVKVQPLKDPLWGSSDIGMYKESFDAGSALRKAYPHSIRVIAGLIPPCEFNASEIQTEVPGLGTPGIRRTTQINVHAGLWIIDNGTGISFANSYSAISKIQGSTEKNYDGAMLRAVDTIADRFVRDLALDQQQTLNVTVYDDSKWDLKSGAHALSEHHYDKAVEIFQKSVTKNSKSRDSKMLAKAYYDLGTALVLNQKYSEAGPYLKKSNDLNPSDLAMRMYNVCTALSTAQ